MTQSLKERLLASKRQRHGIYGRVPINPDGPDAVREIERLEALVARYRVTAGMEAADADSTAARAERAEARVAELEDSVEGLTADLFSAVETAYRRGAHEWARLNYPQWIDRLDANQRAEIQRLAKSQGKNDD